MTHTDLRVLCTALGFLAAVQSDLPDDKVATRAKTISRLIESYCTVELPEYLDDDLEAAKSRAVPFLDQYLTELQENGSARLEHDRTMLLEIYALLRLSRFSDDLKFKEKDFFLNATEDEITAHIVKLAEKELRSRERGPGDV